VWSPKGTTLRVIRCPTLQVSQFLFPGQRSDTFLTDHVHMVKLHTFHFVSAMCVLTLARNCLVRNVKNSCIRYVCVWIIITVLFVMLWMDDNWVQVNLLGN